MVLEAFLLPQEICIEALNNVVESLPKIELSARTEDIIGLVSVFIKYLLTDHG